MKFIYLILLVFCAKLVQAHEPDLSSLMIYEQNGKHFLVIKSSLTAFEGEIDYLFGKNSYKSPEEFQLLVIKHFKENCEIIINDIPITLVNPKVMLGHETTLFAEFLTVPKKISSVYVKNTLFKDMPVNICEVILTFNGLAQKQYLLTKDTKNEVTLRLKNNTWTVVKASKWTYKNPNLLFGLLFFLILTTISVLAIRQKKKTI